ncbi:hypothetical protein [Legionella micdadei]|uniref:Uncharacterized protein n=1 Tax=Legionella micdadei TaxID=451 RepID=A0A098GL78_LEGMI|nr:hypothetical protein [Legionella micdadei]ARG98658.1 hypothetical protein B6N58_13880 [Legionella micdadei]ARH01371.1 hypothetical protein B6V88_13735 [Legionella micdadei]KTD28866.1 hypothetical protein Lmic_0786 [Legionella micdadei]NSL17078.1 hypothetical protein [Legionella micdadei]CEG62246.1 conserved exported protein of unknown function [Legionella micdadei]
MKLLFLFIILLFPFQLQASCKCNCDLADRSLCEPTYDIENPCGGICPSSNPTEPPARTACPTQKVYLPEKGTSVWISVCFD